jgi:TonB family protein
MPLIRASFFVIGITLLSSGGFASKQENEAAALIEHAKRLSDIRAEGAPPFRMVLDLKIINDDGSVTDGRYTEIWVSKKKWRKETEVGGFRRIQIAAGRNLWLRDNTTVVPQQIGAIASISDFSRLRSEAWKSRKDRDINGIGVHCLENSVQSATWALCFEKVGGTLYAEETPPLHSWTGSSNRVCLHSDYQKFGEYTVARSFECQEDKRLKLQARVVDLTIYTDQDPTLFVPPEGAKESLNCLGSPKPPSVIHNVGPTPQPAFHGRNTVMISLVVGTDGIPHDLKVTSPPNHGYDEAALDAVQQWRYKPATCDGEPMEVQIVVESEFHYF